MNPIKSNLEPIEEKDLDLEGKLKRGESINFSAEQKTPFENVEKASEISSAETDSAYNKILSQVQSQQNDDIDPLAISNDAQVGVQKSDAESRVQHLIDIAQQKGVVHAVKVAQHMQDNYVLDTMHDRMLVEDLHDALVKKGMIKDI